MNTSVSWSSRGEASRDTAGPAIPDWLDDLVGTGGRAASPSADHDHRVGMEAIAAQMARLEQPAGPGTSVGGARSTLRDAIAEIARRQAALDAVSVRSSTMSQAAPAEAPSFRPFSGTSRAVPPAPPQTGAGRTAAEGPLPDPRVTTPPWASERSGPRRAGIDLSAEVSQTFARFSREMIDAIHAADVRPDIQALDRQIRHIGRSVEGLGASLPKSRDGSGAEADPTPSRAEVDGALAEMRGLLDTFKPGATIASLETRLDDLANRIERGLDQSDPAVLIEGLSRRVDEIHQSLRSQMAQTAVDTGPLETLVRGISDRIGQAREASAEFGHLERAMRDMAARIDKVPLGTDPRGLQALEGQIAKIGERLERSEAGLRALGGVERSLGELFSQFEVTRQVAIDAAETAARTAARDTLRAALQSPGLAPRSPDPGPNVVDQMARGLDDLRAMHDIAQRRTQEALGQIHEAMERLARAMAADGQGRAAPATREPRRTDADRGRSVDGPSRAAETDRPGAAVDADTPIEPGLGRGGAGRTEPRFDAGPLRDGTAAAETPIPSTDGDGPASFIAAARRAAQAAQASAASAAALKAGRPAPARARPAKTGLGTLDRVRIALAQRRRPLLLGLAALVMLVGALEVVNLGIGGPAHDTPVATDITQPDRPQTRVADGAIPAAATAPAPTPPAHPAPPPPAAASTPPPLPTFVTGQTRSPGASLPADGIPDGLRNLAASGDAAAQYEVGLRYAEGRGVARDPKEGAAWFQKAAAQGLAPAQYRLGSAYEKGVGIDRDPALAMAWYAKAAEAGNVKAMHNMAVMAAEGAAGKPDYAKAAQWFEKASAFGVRDSEFNLAILYARGLGVEQSLAKSYTWFAIAAGQGDDDAGKKRDEVAQKLDPAALASAKAAVEAFRPATPLPAANDVAPPPGGWDAAAPRASSGGNPKVSRL